MKIHPRLRRPAAVLVLASLLTVSGSALPAAEQQTRPNIVLILADDMGYADLPKFGPSEIPTPHIDRLAGEGVVFTNAYVTAPICIPSRMGLLSGQYQQRSGIYCNIQGRERSRRFLQQPLISNVLQDGGYQTALVGKWHLSVTGSSRRDDAWLPQGDPRQRGFHEYLAIPGGGSPYWAGSPLLRNGEPVAAREYLSDQFGKEACSFIERNQDKPFFLYLAFNAVHAPLHGLDEDLAAFPHIADENRRIYAAMLRAMDRNIGRVLAKLDELRLAENTLVIFLTDNGGGGSTDLYAVHSRNYASNAPFRGTKFDVYEGGIRVPMIMRWPRGEFAGREFARMVSSMDVFPTVAAIAGLSPDRGQPIDGVDLRPFLAAGSTALPHEWLCWQNRTWAPRKPDGPRVPNTQQMEHSSAIRRDKWKLVRIAEKIDLTDPPPAWQLYDLAADPGEKQDLALQHPAVVSELDILFQSWRAKMFPSVE